MSRYQELISTGIVLTIVTSLVSHAHFDENLGHFKRISALLLARLVTRLFVGAERIIVFEFGDMLIALLDELLTGHVRLLFFNCFVVLFCPL